MGIKVLKYLFKNFSLDLNISNFENRRFVFEIRTIRKFKLRPNSSVYRSELKSKSLRKPFESIPNTLQMNVSRRRRWNRGKTVYWQRLRDRDNSSQLVFMRVQQRGGRRRVSCHMLRAYCARGMHGRLPPRIFVRSALEW